MVFPKAIPFARITFGKSIAHGYTQSFVAGSQPWNSQAPFQNRFQKFYSHNALAAQQKAVKDSAAESGFADYLKEWQKIQKLGARHWRQYQFARRLEWQPLEDAEGADGEALAASRAVQEAYDDVVR